MDGMETVGGAVAGATTAGGLTTTGASTGGAITTVAMVHGVPGHSVAHSGGDLARLSLSCSID